jgi:hypothetical protein
MIKYEAAFPEGSPVEAFDTLVETVLIMMNSD